MTSAVTQSITHVCDTTNSCITSSKISPSKARLATQRPRTSLFPCETGLDSPPSTHGNESFCNALSVVTRHCSLNNVQWRCPWCSINEGFALLVSTSKKYSVLHSERTQAPSMWTRTSCSAYTSEIRVLILEIGKIDHYSKRAANPTCHHPSDMLIIIKDHSTH